MIMRWKLNDFCMIEDAQGDWVKHEAYEILRANVVNLNARFGECTENMIRRIKELEEENNMIRRIKELEKENNRLEDEVDWLRHQGIEG